MFVAILLFFLLFVVSFADVKMHFAFWRNFSCYNFTKETKKLALLDYCLFALSMPEKAMTDAFSLVPSPDGVG